MFDSSDRSADHSHDTTVGPTGGPTGRLTGRPRQLDRVNAALVYLLALLTRPKMTKKDTLVVQVVVVYLRMH